MFSTETAGLQSNYSVCIAQQLHSSNSPHRDDNSIEVLVEMRGEWKGKF